MEDNESDDQRAPDVVEIRDIEGGLSWTFPAMQVSLNTKFDGSGDAYFRPPSTSRRFTIGSSARDDFRPNRVTPGTQRRLYV